MEFFVKAIMCGIGILSDAWEKYNVWNVSPVRLTYMNVLIPNINVLLY